MSTEADAILDSSTNQTPSVDTKVGVATDGAPPKQAEDRVSSKLEILIRREQAALERERFAKMREAELEEKLGRIKSFEEAKTNPSKALEMLGLNYDQLTQYMLKDGETPPQVEIERLRKELEQIKNGFKEEKDKELERQKEMQAHQERQAVDGFKQEIGEYIKENKDRYELTNYEEAADLVFDVIDKHYQRTTDPETGKGKIMPIAEACDKVEAHFEKKYAESRGLNKVKTMWESLPKETQKQLLKQVNKPEQAKSQPPKTLTNTLSAQVSSRPVRLPEDQRIAKILADFRNTRGA